MFGSRPSRDQLYEKALREKDRLIDVLAEQVEYLRVQLGRPSWSSPLSPHAPTPQPFEMSGAMAALPKEYSGPTHIVPPQFLSAEHAEDMQHLLETGQLDAEDMASAMALLEAQNKMLSDFDPQ